MISLPSWLQFAKRADDASNKVEQSLWNVCRIGERPLLYTSSQRQLTFGFQESGTIPLPMTLSRTEPDPKWRTASV